MRASAAAHSVRNAAAIERRSQRVAMPRAAARAATAPPHVRHAAAIDALSQRVATARAAACLAHRYRSRASAAAALRPCQRATARRPRWSTAWAWSVLSLHVR